LESFELRNSVVYFFTVSRIFAFQREVNNPLISFPI